MTNGRKAESSVVLFQENIFLLTNQLDLVNESYYKLDANFQRIKDNLIENHKHNI